MKLILDTSSLIAFYVEMNAPFLLKELKKRGHKILIPFLVADEISKKDRSYESFTKDTQRKIISILERFGEPETSLFLQRYPYLGGGETEVILWGRRFRKKKLDYCCVLDDKRARRVAEGFSLRYTGTIGIIESLEEWGVISSHELKEILKKLKSAGFRYKTECSRYK